MLTTRLVDVTSRWLDRKVSRRGFLQRTAVVGSAVAVSGLDYVLRPATAYATVCGTGTSCSSGWTAMCCTVNSGVNRCPPGSFAGGWWKADGASLCGGKARYYIDCQAKCHCGCGGGRHYCSQDCWDCKPHCADGGCDKRRVCTNVFRYGQCHQEIVCSGPVWCRAISCTPPWKWESCSTSSATDNNTTTHSAPCLPNGWTAIMQRYTAMGSQGSVLGTTIGGEYDVLSGHGRGQRYEHGRMYWSIDTGAHWLTGAICHHYLGIGGSGSPLRLPTTDVRLAYDDKGHYALFQHGAVYQAPGAYPHALWGAIYTKWTDEGWASGRLGYPKTDVKPTGSGDGHYAHFQRGSIYQPNGGAAHAVWGPIHDKWASLHYETGVLGYPTTDVVTAADGKGHYTRFQHGAIYAGPGLGPHAVWGPIYAAWAADGYEQSTHGYPVTDVQDVTGGQQCTFEHDVATYDDASGTVTWTPR